MLSVIIFKKSLFVKMVLNTSFKDLLFIRPIKQDMNSTVVWKLYSICSYIIAYTLRRKKINFWTASKEHLENKVKEI